MKSRSLSPRRSNLLRPQCLRRDGRYYLLREIPLCSRPSLLHSYEDSRASEEHSPPGLGPLPVLEECLPRRLNPDVRPEGPSPACLESGAGALTGAGGWAWDTGRVWAGTCPGAGRGARAGCGPSVGRARG